MKRIFIYFSSGMILTAILLLMMSDAEATDWHLIDLKELNVNYKRFVSDGRDPLIYPYVHKEAINLDVNMDLFNVFYWDNRILSVTDDAQYRGVGLNVKLGLRITQSLSLQYEHLSQHVLDDKVQRMDKFPVEDSIGLVLKIYQAPGARKAAF